MKAGVILTLYIAGLPAKAAGIYTESTGIILDGSIQLPSKSGLEEALEFLLKKSGYSFDLSFLPKLQAEVIWMTYCQRSSEIGFGIKLRDDTKELGQIQVIMQGVERRLLFRFSSMKALQLSEIPVAGDWMGKGSLGPVEFMIDSDGGMKLSLSYSYGDEKGKALLFFPSDDKKNFLTAGGSANLSDVHWKPIEKSMGCVTLLAVGCAFLEGRLYVMLQTELHLSILTVTLGGLGVCIPFEDLKNTRPVLTGLGLGVNTGGIEISGFFAKELNKPAYSGQLIIRIRTFSFSLTGAYEQAPYTSVFAVGLVGFHLAGTGCIKITKIAAGFGYNRLLSIPRTDDLRQFTLMKMMYGEISAGQAAVEMPARQGQHWLAAGIQFESYGMVRGDVVASVIFGNTLRADLTGKAVLDLDIGSVKGTGENNGSLVLAHVVLLIQASFQPEAGLIAVTAMLGGESYLLSKDCHITGGFACYIWYDKEHKGDFVITLADTIKAIKNRTIIRLLNLLGLNGRLRMNC